MLLALIPAKFLPQEDMGDSSLSELVNLATGNFFASSVLQILDGASGNSLSKSSSAWRGDELAIVSCQVCDKLFGMLR